jgi:gamma-glutamyltranspeptidase/glutathione hydrolase
MFTSRRSPTMSLTGMCASSQKMASKIGCDILEKGGNAMDACVAMSASLAVLEACSTGLGGDSFALYFDNKSKKVVAINGSGKSPQKLTYDEALQSLGYDNTKKSVINNLHVNTVTVPGTCACWVDSIEKYGLLKVSDVLAPAIKLCDGFPVNEITSHIWHKSEELLNKNKHGADLLVVGKTPEFGAVWKNPHLKNVLLEISKSGKDGFYNGWVSDCILSIVHELDGKLIKEDFTEHRTIFTEPYSIDYKGYQLYEVGPNSQGICALIALNILETFSFQKLKHNSMEYLHLLIETMKLAFADVRRYIGDPHQSDPKTIEFLLSKDYAKSRAKLIDPEKASHFEPGYPLNSSDTVQFCCVDSFGNACSFVSSNYTGFGTGIVPPNCGFSLQNRGSNFNFEKGHVNCYEPSKRSYHTIIPALCTRNNELFMAFGVMGAFMQPQGHVQTFLNVVEYEMNSQKAVDQSRFCLMPVEGDVVVHIEDGIDQDVATALSKIGHQIVYPIQGYNRSIFGRSQMITRVNGVLWGGSDPRSDGSAIGI